MTIERDDAASALAAVQRTRRRSTELRGYAHAGDIVAGWGLVWLVCNLLSHFFPDWGPNSWPVGIVAGVVWSMWRGHGHGGGGDWRQGASAATTVALVVLASLIVGIEGPQQANALISLFVAAGYVWMGIWTGPRFAWIGIGIAALVCVGWFLDRGNLYLWLGLGGGGALLLTGLWLRRA